LRSQGVVAARRTGVRLRADPSRVITELFVPGQEGFDRQDSRSSAVVARVLSLNEDEVQLAYDDVIARFDGRHRDLVEIFRQHARQLSDRIDPEYVMSEVRTLLLGATFTSERAIEGAALCNPSIVAHPDQKGVPAGSLRFVMSVRAIGEGHRSSIGFRTGTIDSSGEPTLDPRPRYATKGTVVPAVLHAAVFRSELQRLEGDSESADYVLGALGDRFTPADLGEQLRRLERQLATRQHGPRIIAVIRSIAERTYGLQFGEGLPVDERVLAPSMVAESHGMEDARFVHFTDDDGSRRYYATYTAYDGQFISQQLLETTDLVTFTSSPLVGPASANKGLALFPRRIGGSFVAMCRSDRESNLIAFSDNAHEWSGAIACQLPTRAWEVLQLGNCGSPIETEAGWLVLTHGVGPMRTYSIGAILLDLEDPTRMLSRLDRPLLSPAPDEQDGYVPNVVYSCGALVHADTLVLPHGIGDCAIGLVTVALPELLDSFR
jgi:predicted GH43/DUF377 family glycosyl hydrolase